MYNNPLGKKPSPRSSHRKIITFISKLCRSPAARPLQPPAPSPRACCPCEGVRAGACVRARVCGGGEEGERGGGQERGAADAYICSIRKHKHTRTQKEALSADLAGGEEPRPTRGERRRKWSRGGAGPGPRKFEKSGPESLRLTSFIYQKWYIYKYS